MVYVSSPSNLNPFSKYEIVSNAFKKYFKKIVKIDAIEKIFNSECATPGANETSLQNAKKILDRLKVWGMHYLSKGAKIPLLNQRGSLNLSYIDYLTKHNHNADYFRGDGGPINKALKRQFRDKYLPETPCQLGVVKTAKFVHLMKSACSDSEMEQFYNGKFSYHQLQDLDWETEIEERSFLDISAFLQTAFMNKSTWQEKVKEIQNKVDQLPPETVVGGIVTIDQGVSIYILFTPSTSREESIEEAIEDGLLAKFKNFQGAIGAFPDNMLVKNALVKEGFDLKLLLPGNYSIPGGEAINKTDAVQERIQEEFASISKKMIECLQNSASKNHPLVKFYFPLLINFLSGLQTETCFKSDVASFDAMIDQFILDALEKSSKQVDKISSLIEVANPDLTSPEAFSEVTQRVYLAVEEILSLMCLYTPKEGTRRLGDELESSVQPAVKEGVDRKFFTFSSGMSSLDYVLEAHLQCRQSEGLPKVAFLEGCYYEITSDTGFKGHYAKLCEAEELNISEFRDSKEDFDVMFLDLYPNFVTLKEVKTNPVVELVSHALAQKSGKEPLTVILDTSTVLLSDQEVREIIQELKEPIAQGRLNLAIVSSLAKFYSMGLDKYSGGVIEFYGKTSDPFSDAMQTALGEKVTEDPISQESERFFSLMVSSSLNEVSAFHRQTADNNDYLYDVLKESLQTDEACVRLAGKDPKIPMLGLQFDGFVKTMLSKAQEGLDVSSSERDLSDDFDTALVRFTKFMEFYLYNKAHSRKLPLQIRGSFPFPHASIVECWSALRLIAGLEDKTTLDQYAALIGEVDQELRAFLDREDPGDFIEFLLQWDGSEFMKAVTSQIPDPENTEPLHFENFMKQVMAKS